MAEERKLHSKLDIPDDEQAIVHMWVHILPLTSAISTETAKSARNAA
jgi:hypothetical protein